MSDKEITESKFVDAFKSGYDDYWLQRGEGPVFELTVYFEETCLLVKQYDDLADVIRVISSHLENGAGTSIEVSCFIPQQCISPEIDG